MNFVISRKRQGTRNTKKVNFNYAAIEKLRKICRQFPKKQSLRDKLIQGSKIFFRTWVQENVPLINKRNYK